MRFKESDKKKEQTYKNTNKQTNTICFEFLTKKKKNDKQMPDKEEEEVLLNKSMQGNET